jgi:hypothetical protein
VQASIELKFLEVLRGKMRPMMKAQSVETKQQLQDLNSKGFPFIFPSTIIKCPRGMISSEEPIVNFEVFRTTKEAISFAKCALSIGLWCENISSAFEIINQLKNARQIWLNSSHGITHPKIPFYNGKVVCEDAEVISIACADLPGSMFQVAGNVQFSTTHMCNTFQTVVIPFGETFAN